MALLDWFRSAPPAPRARAEPVISAREAPAIGARPPGRREWLGASSSRLLADLPSGAASAPNREIRMSLRVLRARSRWLAQNDGFSLGYFRNLRRNVLGADGIALQMRVVDEADPTKQDRDANRRIEEAFAEWAAVGAADVTGRLSWVDIQHLALMHIARDGEAFIRKVRAPGFNRIGFALQVIDPLLIDDQLTIQGGAFNGFALAPGNSIRMGIELNPWGRPVAYHARTMIPGDDVWRGNGYLYRRILAGDILHLFGTDWAEQIRGVPWLSAGIRALAMMDGYTEAELTAARISAGKMGFYKFAENANRDDVDAKLQADASLVQEAAPGTFELLPNGIDFESYDPQHPNSSFKDFQSGIMRNAAAGAGLSYASFANDAAGLNYSALRATELEDRDEYRTIQGWMIRNLCAPVFGVFLTECLISGVTGLPPGKSRKFNAPQFIGRGWQWVDPGSEVAAARDAVALGIRSRRQIVAEAGGDFDAVVADLKAEDIALSGITPPAPASQNVPVKQGASKNAAV